MLDSNDWRGFSREIKISEIIVAGIETFISARPPPLPHRNLGKRRIRFSTLSTGLTIQARRYELEPVSVSAGCNAVR